MFLYHNSYIAENRVVIGAKPTNDSVGAKITLSIGTNEDRIEYSLVLSVAEGGTIIREITKAIKMINKRSEPTPTQVSEVVPDLTESDIPF